MTQEYLDDGRRETADSHQKKEIGIGLISRFLRVEVTLVIAVAIGIFTLSGYAYLEKYYNTLDVPMSRINITTQTLLAYGGASISSLIFAVSFAAALVAVPTLVMALFEKPGKTPPTPVELRGWPARIRDRAIEIRSAFVVVGAIVSIAAIAFLIYHIALQKPSDRAHRSAFREVKNCTEQTLRYRNAETYNGCVIAESDDLFYLIEKLGYKTKDKTMKFKTIRLPKSGLVIARSETRLIKNEDD
jgi:hypothetical protein